MLSSKLVIVTGMSGTGKSSTSQQLAKQYEFNSIPHRWIHEEIEDHPIRRKGEFTVDSLETEEGMAQNVVEMYARWKALADEIEQSGLVYIMEGCFYQSIIRYFFASCYSEEQIKHYYSHVLQILHKLNPTIVFLYRSDVKASFQKAFQVRGEQWQKLILDWEGEGYFKRNPYQGDDSIFAMWEKYQQLSDEHFDQYQGNKIKLLTADGQWNKHIKELTEFMELTYVPIETPSGSNPEQYAGAYSIELGGQQRLLTFKVVDGALYGQTSWWSNMALIPLGNHEFEVLSFPIKYTFHLDEGKTCVTVTEGYGWGLSGQTLVKI